MINKTKERIYKYLSGLLNEKEQTKFLKELEISSTLKSEYEKILKQIRNLNQLSEIEVDEDYLFTLLPKVKSRLENNRLKPRIIKLAYVIPIIILIVVLLFPIKRNNNTNIFSFDSLRNQISKKITLVDTQNLNLYLNDYSFINRNTQNSFIIELPGETENSKNFYEFSKYYFSENTIPVVDGNLFLNKLTETDLNGIYKKLINNKFFRN